MKLRCLGPDEAPPDWIPALERSVFGEAWGGLAPQELLWILGEAAYARWSQVPVVGEAELLRIAVDPAARRRGLGRRLLGLCERELHQNGIRSLHLEVRLSNIAAQALYEAVGWRRTGQRQHYYRDGEDAVLYSKALG